MKKLILIFVVAVSGNAFAYQVTDAVTTPTVREANADGVIISVGLSELAAIQPYCGATIGDYSYTTQSPTIAPNIKLPTTTVTMDLPLGISYCVFTVIDTGKRQSLYSGYKAYNVIGKKPVSLPLLPPVPPTVLQNQTMRVLVEVPTTLLPVQ